MRKILIGVLAAVLVAGGGWFGFQFYVQHRAAAEVDAAFAQIHAAGGKASHGQVTFDLWTRTLTIADIASESAEQPPNSIKIASLTARGLGQDVGRISADGVEIENLDVVSAMPMPDLRGNYHVPRLTIAAISAPSGPAAPRDGASAADLFRHAIDLFRAITAASVSAPTLTLRLNATTAGSPTSGAGEYVYTNLIMRNIKDGKVAASTIERLSLAANIDVAGKVEKMTGEMRDASFDAFDVGAVAAIFDPASATDDSYRQMYRQAKIGAYAASVPSGAKFRIEGMNFDDIGIRPSRMQLPLLMALVASAPPPGRQPDQAQIRAVMDKAAGIYEGVHIGNAEMRGLSVDTPQGPIKLAALRFNLEGGKIGELAVEGLEGRSQQGPLKVGRFALRSFDVAGLIRAAGNHSAGQFAPDQLLALLSLLEGAEVAGVVGPYKDRVAPVNIEAASLNWGQFVGPIPTKAHLATKLTVPLDTADPALAALIAAGIHSAAVNVDVGAAWSETARSFVLEPVIAELGGVLNVSARLSLGNVPRDVFSTNPLQAAVMAAQIEAGTVELTLRDLGGVDLALTQFARMQNVGRQGARQTLIDAIRANAANLAETNPQIRNVADALVRFISTPQGSLTIKLTPQGKVPMMELINALKAYPMRALAKFQITASTGL